MFSFWSLAENIMYLCVCINNFQPVFTWGAVGKAIEAAELGVKAVQHKSDIEKNMSLARFGSFCGKPRRTESQRI